MRAELTMQTQEQAVKTGLDYIAGGTVIAAWLSWVPDVTAVIALVYLLIRVWETDTVQRLLGRKKQ